MVYGARREPGYSVGMAVVAFFACTRVYCGQLAPAKTTILEPLTLISRQL